MLWGPGETSTQDSGRLYQESKVTHVTSTSHRAVTPVPSLPWEVFL